MGVDNTVSVSYGINLDEYLPSFLGDDGCLDTYLINQSDPSLLGLPDEEYVKLSDEEKTGRYEKRQKIVDDCPVEIHDYWVDSFRYYSLIIRDFHPAYSDGFAEIDINNLTPEKSKIEAAETWCSERDINFSTASLFASALYA